MPRSFSIGSLKEPRVVMRAIMGALLAGNLAVAVVAFHPFGGSADDLRRQRQSLTVQLAQAEGRLAQSRRMVSKVESARTEGDRFMGLYFMDVGKASAIIVDELFKMAQTAGIQMGQTSFNKDPIEGSDTLVLLSAQVGFEGSYANLTKFINLLDKSPRYLIIENMNAAAPQGQAAVQQGPGGQALNVTLKIDAFIKDPTGGAAL